MDSKVCAGITDLVLTLYPRVCGEHLTMESPQIKQVGSSPRVRGTRRAVWHEKTCLRFIPACAGNTFRIGITA